MPFTNAKNVIALHQRATESFVAEHYPREHGMQYLIRVVGGVHHGIEINCPTEASTLRLFKQIVAARKRYEDHPFLAVV